MNSNDVFMKSIRVVMKEHGFTQKQIAEVLHISPVSVSRYLTGERRPSLETIVTIAESLHVTTDELLGVNTIKENTALLNKCFRRASERDQELIWHILREYMTDVEREVFDDWRAAGEGTDAFT